MLSRDMLNNCAKTILKILTTTKLEEQEKIVEIAKIMSDSAKLGDEYTPDMIEVYETSYKLLSKLSERDFGRVLEISKENND